MPKTLFVLLILIGIAQSLHLHRRVAHKQAYVTEPCDFNFTRCADGLYCVESVCLSTSCVVDFDCTNGTLTGYVCSNSSCIPDHVVTSTVACTADSLCPSTQEICHADGFCYPIFCIVDQNCGAGYHCASGTCTINSTPPPPPPPPVDQDSSESDSKDSGDSGDSQGPKKPHPPKPPKKGPKKAHWTRFA